MVLKPEGGGAGGNYEYTNTESLWKITMVTI